MGIDLVNIEDRPKLPEAHRYERFSLVDWIFVLNIAEIYGWPPAGTLPPHDWKAENGNAPWAENDYESNSWQEVTLEDAHNIARALDDALADDLRRVSWKHKPTKAYKLHVEKNMVTASYFCHKGAFVIT